MKPEGSIGRASRIAPIVAALLLTGCETTNSSDWTGGAGTPFDQAERSCQNLVPGVSHEENRRDFLIGCMRALGWTPKSGASIEL